MKKGSWNPARVFAALGKIGYHPVSAVLDITDNSVSAGADKIDIIVEAAKVETGGRGRKKSRIDRFVVIDNGQGMDEKGIDNALSLGSSEEYYHRGTLSKFGMGLKSAASSLGGRLEIISRSQGGSVFKAVLDYDVISEEKDYVYELSELEGEELKGIEKLISESGTIVRVSKIHHESMPPIVEILSGLQKRAGVVYYYYLDGKIDGVSKLSLTVNGGDVSSFDPLFENDIDAGEPNLDEKSWDGVSTKWITRPQPIQLDPTGKTNAVVAMTQLPHPPSMADKELMTQKGCRDKYMIGAGNYGFYIYRNSRLISWADSLEMVGQDQDLYSFRGRLLITSDADNILNIDVTKSRIHLSEIAQEQLVPLVQEAKKKSLKAWATAKERISAKNSQHPHEKINEELDKVGELLEKSDSIDEDLSGSEEKKRLAKKREAATKSKVTTDSESKRLSSEGQRVQYVGSLDNNQLWELAHDPKHGLIVRINQSHRLYKELIEGQRDNADLVKVMDVLFFALARGEYSLVYKSEHDGPLVESILGEYRERVGGDLSEIIRKLDMATLLDS